MKAIYKYPLIGLGLPFHNQQYTLQMPQAAKILSLQKQNNDLVIWALVETDNPQEIVEFYFYNTGKEISGSEDKQYLCTIQLIEDDEDKCNYVIHVFIRRQGNENTINQH